LRRCEAFFVASGAYATAVTARVGVTNRRMAHMQEAPCTAQLFPIAGHQQGDSRVNFNLTFCNFTMQRSHKPNQLEKNECCKAIARVQRLKKLFLTAKRVAVFKTKRNKTDSTKSNGHNQSRCCRQPLQWPLCYGSGFSYVLTSAPRKDFLASIRKTKTNPDKK
jgi:spore germination protein YaaH